MELGRPFRVVTPTVDGDVLGVLARADAEFTPPEVHRLIGEHSESGVRKVLKRLERQGIVSSRTAGRATSYALNREHIAAPPLIALAGLREELLERMRTLLAAWVIATPYAALFGSGAGRGMRATSDLDIFVVRPTLVDPDDPRWRSQVDGFTERVTAWTGNDTRILEYAADEAVDGALADDRLLLDITDRGIDLAGPADYLGWLRRARATR